jgi:hypothetical protein
MAPKISMERLQDERVMNHNHVTLAEYPDTAGGTMPMAVDMATSSRSSSSSSSSRRVHFGRVQTRYYQHILGDHPLCSDGLPLTFGWTFQEDDYADCLTTTVCTYTAPTIRILGGGGGKRLSRVPRMTILARMSILLESGVSEDEIVRRIHKFHKNARRTYRKQQRAKLWTGIVKTTERTLESFRFYYR